MTAFPADVADIFVERVHPSNPHRVEYRGQWVDTTIVRDPIVMKGQAKPFPFEREYTPNGVLVATDSERHLAFTVKWSGSEPGAAGALAALAFDRAASAAEFRAALAHWKSPAVDVVFADADGLAGRQVAGLIPNRRGWDGALPAPGWSAPTSGAAGARRPAARHAAARGTFNRRTRTPRGRTGLRGAGARTPTRARFERLQHDTTPGAPAAVPLLAPRAARTTSRQAPAAAAADGATSDDAPRARVWERRQPLLPEKPRGRPKDHLGRAVSATPMLETDARVVRRRSAAARDRLRSMRHAPSIAGVQRARNKVRPRGVMSTR